MLVLTALLTATSCKSSGVKAGEGWKQAAHADLTSALHTDPDLWKKAVTQIGQNEGAVFSPNGEKILVISRERLNHRQRQLYELDLKNKTERRLTFQDGEVVEAVYSPFDRSIFYTSTTDEIKEKPLLFYPELYKSPWPMTDIYKITDGEDVHQRWTENTGFDGFIFIHEDPSRGQAITISRRKGDRLVLLRSGLKTPQFEQVLDRLGVSFSVFYAHRREPWRAWVEESTLARTSKIVVSRRGQKLASLNTKLIELRHLLLWSAKDSRGLSSEKSSDEDVHILVTAKKTVDGPRQAFWIDFAKQCASPFDLGPGEITSLDLSPDQKQLAWTLSQGSTAQVFIDNLAQPTSLCEPL